MDSYFLIYILTGLAYSMILFMIAIGLSIIYGLMNIINLAHGSFFMFGAYIAFSLLKKDMNFWLALIISVIVTAVLGFLIERFLLSYIYGKELEQVLLTFGLVFVFSDVVKWIWGADFLSLPTPSVLNFSLSMGSMVFPVYRLFIVLLGIVLVILLWYYENRTRIGAIIRAGVDDREMLAALGINVKLVFSIMFSVGVGLAAMSGVLGGPVLGIYPGVDIDVLINSLIVVVIGGLGTWKGSFFGAILVGMIDTLGKVWFPSLSMVLIFFLMVVVLLIKPSGLFGRGETR